MQSSLEFKKVIDNKELVAESTYNCIKELYTEEEK